MAAPFTHLLADFADVPAAQLRDVALVTGLLIAAASAAGLTAHVLPIVRTLPTDGLVALYPLEASHIAVQTFPERGLLLMDVLVDATHDAQRVVDVFARRLDVRPKATGSRGRG